MQLKCKILIVKSNVCFIINKDWNQLEATRNHTKAIEKVI